jgi:hypothetical protein
MTRIMLIKTDLISVNPYNPRHPRAILRFPSQSFFALSSTEFYICRYMKHPLTQILLLSGLLVTMMTISSCANMIPPGGGPRDSLAPVLVMASVKDSAVNVSRSTKIITLAFDEYVTIDNYTQNLIISPAISSQDFPMVDYKLKNVIIKLKDTLESNTTYSFNFGNAIKDVNEGNIAQNFIYSFSTGKTIDYNTYSGKVIVAETGKPHTDSTLLVVLHKNLDDSAVKKLSPRYIARMNAKGEFIFHNLPQGKFAVYVLASSFDKKYNDSTSMFAFRNSPVTISANTASDTLYAFEAFKRIVKPATASAASVKISATNKEDKRLKYAVNFDNAQQDLLGNLVISFNHKLTSFDSTKFVLYDTSYGPITGYSVSLDSSKTKMTLQYPWKEGTPFRLLIAKDAVADSAGTTLVKADTLRFFTKKESDYGSIYIRFTNLDLTKNPVLQILQNNALLESIPLTEASFQRKRFRPGGYDLRILFDANKNGVWDTGIFGKTKRQPEIVFAVPKPIAIRANWDNEVTVGL